MNEMNEWVFFALFALLLAVTEFVSGRAAKAVAVSLPPEERTLSPRRQLAVRLAQLAWYAGIGSATIAYWLGSEFARDVLGWLFLLTAVLALLSGASWISSRRR